MRATWYQYLNEPDLDRPMSMVVTVFLASAIVLNIIQVVLGSDAGIEVQMGSGFVIGTYIFSSIFAIEYVLRIWVAVEAPSDSSKSDSQKRWDYVLSPMGLIDLISFLPVLLWLLLPDELWVDLRMLKLISMIRVLKLTRYSASLLMLSKVLRENKNTLLAAAMVMFILMLIASTGIYLFERHAQPSDFGSIPSSMWWAFVTLTTVGYGDVTPITLGGKVFGSIVMVCGVGIAAMPAGIFASSFVQLIRQQEDERRRSRKKHGYHKHNNQKHSHQNNGHPEATALQVVLSASEERELEYLMHEYDLTLDQALGVVNHYRRGPENRVETRNDHKL